MPNASLRTASTLAALAAFLPLAAFAAAKPFTGPAAGWDHTVGVTATAQAPRALETWKKSDGEQVTYLSDSALSYDDTMALVKKNITDNGFKATVDTDRKCDGRRAHELEMTFGTTVVHQVIVDDAPGLTKLTYTRPQGTPVAADVTSAITAYCGSAQ
ncbi:MAG: hypothetical protein QOD51_2145 [Candidatus Eremiobacteraeota bacterium]|jgi:hypothetical protein|nr:hypothetical protein [Candidatus Eremiobacteraeota bacterium]